MKLIQRCLDAARVPTLHGCVVASIALSLGSALHGAQNVPVVNPSFEQPPLAPGVKSWFNIGWDQSDQASIPGWGARLLTGGGGQYYVWGSTAVQNVTNAPDGQQTVSLAAGGTTAPPPDAIYQDVGPLLPNTTYTLTVSARLVFDYQSNGGNGAIVLVNGTDSLGTELAWTSFYLEVGPNVMKDYSVTYVSGPETTGHLTIALENFYIVGGNEGHAEVQFDNVRLQAESPPHLDITMTGQSVTLSWPLWATNYFVERSDNLGTGQWEFFSRGSPVPESNSVMTNLVTSTPAYFRLHKLR